MLKSDSKAVSIRGYGPTGAIRRAHLSMQRCADAIFSVAPDYHRSILLTLDRAAP